VGLSSSSNAQELQPLVGSSPPRVLTYSLNCRIAEPMTVPTYWTPSPFYPQIQSTVFHHSAAQSQHPHPYPHHLASFLNQRNFSADPISGSGYPPSLSPFSGNPSQHNLSRFSGSDDPRFARRPLPQNSTYSRGVAMRAVRVEGRIQA
jgi:hypothetical protein